MSSLAMPLMAGGHVAPVIYPDTANSQSVTISGTSAASAVIHATEDRVVRIVSQTACWYSIGTAPTAVADTAGSTYLPADAVEYIAITAGDKIAAIQDATGGEFSITPAKVIG